VKQRRLEKAESLLLSQYGSAIGDLPEQLQQFYYFQKGMIRMAAGDIESATELIERAISDDSDQGLSEPQLMFMTISSALQAAAGNAELAELRLNSAERAVRRARINGVDDANINYTESSIHALRGNAQAALEKLQIAYERGFRQIWLLDLDARMDSLRQEPQFVALKEQIERDIVQARSEVESLRIAAL